MARLDSHVHIFNRAVIGQMRDAVDLDGLTHYGALIEDLELIPHLDEAGAHGLPFHWIHDAAAVDADPRIVGYKIHPREPLEAREPFPIDDPWVHRVLAHAGARAMPVLFHTDTDEPKTCTVPALAKLAEQYPDTPVIAAHMGVFGNGYFRQSKGREYTPETWAIEAERAFAQNLQLLVEVDNLYADVTLFGVDDPVRGPDPDQKFRGFATAVERMTSTGKQQLSRKLFIGTDYPCFWDDDNRNCTVGYQAECMQVVFGDIFDEGRAAADFIALCGA